MQTTEQVEAAATDIETIETLREKLADAEKRLQQQVDYSNLLWSNSRKKEDAADLARMTVVIPRREVRYIFSHDTLGDGLFAPLVREAMIEAAARSMDDISDEFIASNGVRVECIGLMAIDPDDEVKPTPEETLAGLWSCRAARNTLIRQKDFYDRHRNL